MTTTARVLVPTVEVRARRAALTGAVIGFTVVLVAVWALCAAHGVASLDALGLGLFVASWGGLGFGAMLAAAVTIAMGDRARS
jgi:hypothetical protein